MSQDAESAITTTESLAAELEQGWNEQEQPVEAEQEETQDISPDEDGEVEDAEPETSEEDKPDTEESEDQEPEAEDSETPRFETLEEIAEAIDMPLDEFMANIKTTRKIDGVEEEISLAEQRDGNQRDADYRRKTTELAENRKAFEGEIEQTKAKLGQQYQEVAAMTTNLEQQLLGEFQSIDWNALEIEDREEWLVKRQKFGERQQQIEAIKNQSRQQLTEQQQEIQAKQAEARQQAINEQQELLLAAIPEWSDTTTREAERKEMTGFLGNYGYTEAEVGNVIDHRLVKLVRDAMQNKGKTSQIDIAKNKVKKLPKLVKPGSKPDKAVVKKKAQQDKRKEFIKKDRHSTEELADYFMNN
jgi:hypothetical protein